MRIPKVTSITLVLIALSTLILGGCKEDPNNLDPNKGTQCKVTVQLGLDKEVELAKLMLTVTDSRTLKKSETEVDKKSRTVELTLDKGTYSFAVSGETTDQRALLGKKESLVISEDMTIKIPVQLAQAPDDGKSHLIFGDIFFNGETNELMMAPDQYFMVVNNGEKIEYLDGVCWGVTEHANILPDDQFTDFLKSKGELPISTIFQFPGNGKDYPIKPGEYKIVASTAINHRTSEHLRMADLSGADFEVVFPEEVSTGVDPDNLDVVNLVNVDVPSPLFMMPKGFLPPVLFKVSGDLKAFLKEHVMQVKDEDGNTVNVYTIPLENILDGVETGAEGMFNTHALPMSVDAGTFLVLGGHKCQLAHRKTEQRNGRTYWIDTNNSTSDYECVLGQNSYPAKKP